jgi:hypothetical protein
LKVRLAAHQHEEKVQMTRFVLTSGIIATLALGALSFSAHADSYYGPRQVGDKCWTPAGGPNSMGFWQTCKEKAAARGATANARVNRSAKGAPTQARTQAPAGDDAQ